MTHVDNIPHILEFGITHRNSENANPNYVSIGDSSLIDNRFSTVKNITNGSDNIIETITIGDFIPFYFGIRTPMLYVIQKGFNGVKKRNPEEIIYCVSDIQTMIESGFLFYFSDGHTSKNELTTIYNSTKISEVVDIVDFEATKYMYWKSENDLDLKRRKEAEFLVKNDLPKEAIKGYVCFNESAKNRLLEMGVDSNMIVVKPNYYF
ncbi:MAG: type II toxin-antitoxin system toxin DNA ADP-ribosyl transferase DarT [Flavobacterium sp.]